MNLFYRVSQPSVHLDHEDFPTFKMVLSFKARLANNSSSQSANRESEREARKRARQLAINKRHAMHAEAMTFHKGSLRIFRKVDRKFQES